MSTLLTPIITQLEIDRDRFKVLINGDETETVQLENRTEKSIAGQVVERIDALAFDLSAALQRAEDAEQKAAQSASDASLSKGDAETAASAAQAAQGETKTLRDEAEVFRDEAEQARNSIMEGSVTAKAELFDGNAIYPVQYADPSVFPIENLHLMGQTADANSDRIKFISRTFDIVEMDSGFDPVSDQIDEVDVNYTVVLTQTTTSDSLYVGNIAALNETSYFAWSYTDTYVEADSPAPGVYYEQKTKSSDWEYFKLTSSSEHISKPTVSTATVHGDVYATEISISPSVVNNSSRTIDHTVIRIYRDNSIVKEIHATGEKNTFTIPDSDLKPDSEYQVKAQYVIDVSEDEDGTSTFSPFSDEVSFSTKVAPRYLSHYHTKSESTTGVIDVDSSTVFVVNGTSNTNLTLSQPSLPSDRAMSVIVFIEGSGGSITWPVEVSWAGGNEPELGTTWTNIVLFWTGTMWIGMESAKQ